MLLARARERAAIDEMLCRVRSGHGEALVFRGEPGIGKTALLCPAGGTGSLRDPAVLSTLTPQERRIALAISEGSTNRGVAAQLFLSSRTVGYHLRKIFQRVGIRSRAELIRLVLTDSESHLGRDDGNSDVMRQ